MYQSSDPGYRKSYWSRGETDYGGKGYWSKAHAWNEAKNWGGKDYGGKGYGKTNYEGKGYGKNYDGKGYGKNNDGKGDGNNSEKKTMRGTKHRGGKQVQAKRQALIAFPDTAQTLGRLYRDEATQDDINYLTVVFGRPQLDEMIAAASSS